MQYADDVCMKLHLGRRLCGVRYTRHIAATFEQTPPFLTLAHAWL
jgi:hypothetical protein